MNLVIVKLLNHYTKQKILIKKNNKLLYGNIINYNNFYNNNKCYRRNNNICELFNKKRKQSLYMRYEFTKNKNYIINNTINQIEKGNVKLKQIFFN